MSLCSIRRFLRNIFAVGTGFFFLIPLALPFPVQAGSIPSLEKHITNGGYALSNKGTVIAEKNLHIPFIPASTIKLLTSLAAITILGPDYRFNTRLFLDTQQNLYILGSGDPFLVSEKIATMTQLLAQQGIDEIRDIILDDSYFALTHETPGSTDSRNPYDAQCSALGVNFNTLPLRVLQNAKVQSSERQTPYIPLMGKIGMPLTSGRYRVNINAFPDQQDLSNSLQYSGQLFRAFLKENRIRMSGIIKRGIVPADAQLFVDFVATETVTELVRSCLLSSSNFMANQLYLAIGAAKYGSPASWEKSAKAMGSFIQTHLGLTKKQISTIEGSGLSKANRITPQGMLTVLEKFKPYASLLPHKYGVQMKSGTLNKSGVFCYAGYFPIGSTDNSFVILLNQKNNNRDIILRTLFRFP